MFGRLLNTSLLLIDKEKTRSFMFIFLIAILFRVMKMIISENVKLQFIQKDILLFKISYISVCSKTFLRLRVKQKV